MNHEQMNQHIDEVLEQMDAAVLEERIAPVDCQKKPDHPDCQVHTLYGIPGPIDAEQR